MQPAIHKTTGSPARPSTALCAFSIDLADDSSIDRMREFATRLYGNHGWDSPEQDAERKDFNEDGCLEREPLVVAIHRRDGGERPVVELQVERDDVHVEYHFLLHHFDLDVPVVDHFADLQRASLARQFGTIPI